MDAKSSEASSEVLVILILCVMTTPSPSTTQWASSLRDSTSQSPGAFRIPGPSTRFHKEHKQPVVQQEARPKYTRFASNADSPATRTRSRLSVSPITAGQHPLPMNLQTRPEHNRRKSTPISGFMSQGAPLTPVRSPHRSSINFGDSPFSDYFTDENRSVDEQSNASYAFPPSSESQKLLLRLNTLGAEILRQDPSRPTTITNLGAKLDDLEAALRTPSCRSTRRTSTLADDGDGDGDEEEDDTQTPEPAQPSADQSSRPSTPQSSLTSSTDFLPPAIKTRLRNQDRLLKEAQDVLQRVSKANDGLRKRYDEIRHLHEATLQELEECSQENLQLKSENESLRADLGFDHSELLFMKLQLKALEVEADAASDRPIDDAELNNKRVLLNDDIDRWKADWDDVDARLRSRRERNRVVSSTPEKLSSAARDSPKTEDHGNWRLDMCKKRHGRLQSITIKRFNSFDSEDSHDDTADDGEDEDEKVLTEPPSSPKHEQGVQTAGSTSCQQVVKTIWEEKPAQPEPNVNKPLYCANATQTTEPFLSKSEWDQMRKLVEAADQQLAELSGEEDSGDDHSQEDQESDEEPPKRTPWRELCDSLVSFAGMDRD